MAVRTTPAPKAAVAAPTWCDAAIQPNTTGASSLPKASLVSFSVGGTVAIQSSP